jgi:hypothetical protein
MNSPQYAVTWLHNRLCEACGQVHKEQHTWSFFTPQAALGQATFILAQPGYVLLSVDQ